MIPCAFPLTQDPQRAGNRSGWIATLLLTAGVLAGCGRAPAPGPVAQAPTPPAAEKVAPWFREVGTRAGINFRHSTGHQQRYYMPEVVTGGVGLLDFDGDDWLDVLLITGGLLGPGQTNPANQTNQTDHRLYRNLGGWRFEDVTDRCGVNRKGEYGMGCAIGDYDNDGRPDIYITHVRGGRLLKNSPAGTFVDVTEQAGLTGTAWGTSAAWFDLDNDGHLDLVIANYLRWTPETEVNCYSQGGRSDYCSPLNYKAPAMATLWHNRGDGRFEDVTLAAGLDKAYGNGLGVACADFNQDGRLDIYIANDALPNQLWINQGNGRFADEAPLRGCAVNSVGMPRAGMGVAVVDTYQRGALDLFITHLVGEGNGWFVNTNGYFTDTLTPRGPHAPSLPLTGFGVGFGDFDHDGILDLYVANGRVKFGARDLSPDDPYAEPNTLLQGLGPGEFQERQPAGGTEPVLLGTSRGAALGDLDNDGDLDVVVVNKDGPVHVLENIAPKKGRSILLHLRDARGLDAINASVRIEAGGRVWRREVLPNQGYASSHDARLHVGLGDASTVDRVLVRWRTGREESFGPFEPGSIAEVVEGKGRPASASRGESSLR